MQDIFKQFQEEINTYYLTKADESHHLIDENNKSLGQVPPDFELPEILGKSINSVNEFNLSPNIRVPSPVAIGTLRSLIIDSDYIGVSAYIDFIASKGLCIQVDKTNEEEAHQFLQNIALKMLLSLNPGVINLMVMDIEGSGSNFNILCGYEKAKPNFVFNKSDIESKLSSITANFQKLQTESLTHKYLNLEQLNLNEGKLTKPYTFLFISNFPSGFNSATIKSLQNIIQKGPKFGTFVFMSYNPNTTIDYGKEDELKNLLKGIAILKESGNGYQITQALESDVYNHDFSIQLDSEKPEKINEIVSHLNKNAKEASSKAVTQSEYFDQILKEELPIWQEYSTDESLNKGVDVPIGLKTAKDELEFTIDCGTDNYHVIIGGKTGSGKTVLLDNIIVNAAIKYSPEELQFVLLDFKGASFQKYRNLPHLKILFGGNDRSYGLNVLRFLESENTRRQSILASLGGKISALSKVDRIHYNFPRMIIILDEFQVLLKELDSIKNQASKDLDTIAQQGRSAGMHLILASQDLTGVTISESTQYNSGMRIAMQMDPQACKQIFSNENTDASLLEKKGEAIYNDRPGRPKHGNHNFQVYNLEDSTAKRIVGFLDKKYQESGSKKFDRYFLPNENSATINNNLELVNGLFQSDKKILYPRLYIGEPTFIKVNRKTYSKEDTYLQFKRAENSNLLLAGNDMSTASSILGLSILQLLNQHPEVQFHVLNNFGGDKIQWRERFKLLDSASENFKYHQKSEAQDVLKIVEEAINIRKTDEVASAANFFFVILNLDSSFQKQGFTVSENAKRLTAILKQGPDLGVHTIIYSYSGKSLSNAGIEPDVFEQKIVLKGDGDDIIKMTEGRKDPPKFKMAYLYAPNPITSINPDLFNIYSLFDENTFATSCGNVIKIISEFLKEIDE